MNITPEMARAELERRGALKQGGFSSITPEMARAELARRRALKQSDSSSKSDSLNIDNGNSEKNNQLNKLFGIGRTPIDTVRDVAGGAMKGAQNIAALLGEGGQAIGDIGARLVTGKWPQEINIREELGLGKDRPVDLESIISSKNPNPLLQGLGQYAPAIIAGGASLPGQMLSNALYGSTQASPEQKNLFGILPEGRPGAALEGALLSALPLGVGKVIGKAREGINYLRPNKSSEEFIKSIGQGKTAGENIDELAGRVKFARSSAERESLTPKNELFATESNSRIFPSQERGNKLVKEVSTLFGTGKADEQQLKTLSKALKKYYKTNDLDELVSTGEDIFHHSGLNKNKINQLDKVLELEPLKNGSYLNLKDVTKGYDEGMKELHRSFSANPILENSDKLKIALGREKRRLEGKIESGIYNESDLLKLNRITKNEEYLLNDIESFVNTLSPSKQNKYRNFRTLWATNMPKYEESGNVIRQLSEGEGKGLTRENITSSFKFPKEDVLSIANEIGSEGKKNILYNYLINSNPNNAKEVANALLKAKRSAGFEPYVSKSHEEFANELLKRVKARSLANKIALVVGGGAAAGYGAKKIF